MDHMKIVYSDQAQVMIDNMPDFPKKDFEKWWWEQKHQIGSQNVLQFLLHISRMNVTETIKVKK